MKKIISLGLALVMIALSLSACKKTNGDEKGSTKDPIPSINETETPFGTTEPDEPDESLPSTDDVVFEDCDETVYVVTSVEGLKLRKTTSFDGDSNVAKIVDPGTELRRIGYNEVWSKVVFENKEYFTSSKYLTKDKPSDSTETEKEIVFKDVDEKVYIKTGTEGGSANIYSKPSKSNPITDIALPTEGTELKRTGIAYDTENDPEGLGWSRIVYKDRVCYIRNSVLSTKAPKA